METTASSQRIFPPADASASAPVIGYFLLLLNREHGIGFRVSREYGNIPAIMENQIFLGTLNSRCCIIIGTTKGPSF